MPKKKSNQKFSLSLCAHLLSLKIGIRRKRQHMYKTIKKEATATTRQPVSSSQRQCRRVAAHGLSGLRLGAGDEVLVLDCHTLGHVVDLVHAH